MFNVVLLRGLQHPRNWVSVEVLLTTAVLSSKRLLEVYKVYITIKYLPLLPLACIFSNQSHNTLQMATGISDQADGLTPRDARGTGCYREKITSPRAGGQTDRHTDKEQAVTKNIASDAPPYERNYLRGAILFLKEVLTLRNRLEQFFLGRDRGQKSQISKKGS